MSRLFDWLKPLKKTRSTSSERVEACGQIDEIDEDGMIVGWAFSGMTEPATIRVTYEDQHICDCVADRFRKDLKSAGIGDGNHAFRLHLPCDIDAFRIERLDIRIINSIVLRCGSFFDHWNALDVLYSPVTNYVNIEITSRCNLRCAYCRVSHKDYHGTDLDSIILDNFINGLKARRVHDVTVNGHGESTIVPGWHHRVNQLADQGFRLSIISNLARLLEADELSAMARIAFISVSVDTHDAILLSKIRRKVKIDNIVENMASIRSKAVDLGLPQPIIGWSCVVSDRVALGILDYVRFGLSNGVKNFYFCNIVEYSDIESDLAVRHVSTLGDGDFCIFAREFSEARQIIIDAGGAAEIAGDLAEIVNARWRLGAIP